MVARIAVAAAVLATLSVAAAGSSWSAQPRARALVGVNYSHFSINGRCAPGAKTLEGTGILANDRQRGVVAAKVARQMQVMAARGIQALRLILWHQTNPGHERWGVVSSDRGRLSNPVRAALVSYLKAARQADFARLTISFGPRGSNNPREPSFDSSKFDENWKLIRQVRSLARRFGPRSIHIDLGNEAPQNSSDPVVESRVGAYLATLYRRYVRAYGNEDVSVSTIANQAPDDTKARLQNLISALRSTGLPPPRWFDVHPSSTYALRDLRVIDQVLAARGLNQPLVLSEVAYNNRGSAEAIARYERSGDRRVLEVTEWPLTPDALCRHMSVSPPYRADEYIRH